MTPVQRLTRRLNSLFRQTPQAQALVEFALAMPIFLVMLFGIVEFGRLMQAYLALENGARFGVRYAASGNFDVTQCDKATILH